MFSLDGKIVRPLSTVVIVFVIVEFAVVEFCPNSYFQYNLVPEATNAATPEQNKEDGSARILFYVQVSNESIALFPRLFERLYSDSQLYAIHFELDIPKNHTIVESAKAEFIDCENVYFVSPQLVTYMGISIVYATLDAMYLLIDEKWDYFINMSGSDYPLLPPDNIAEVLEVVSVPSNEYPQVESFQRIYASLVPWEYRWQSATWDPALAYTRPRNDKLTLVSNGVNQYPFKPEFAMLKGSAWIMVSKNFCKDVISSPFARRLLGFFSHGDSIDESYFQSFMANSKYQEFNVDDHFRYLEFVPGYQHPETLTLTGNRTINPFTMQDLTPPQPHTTAIVNSGAIIARKFSNQESVELMDFIDCHLLGIQNSICNSIARIDGVSPEIYLKTTKKRLNTSLRDRFGTFKIL